MRTAIKYLPVLLLGSVLGGCSMAGTGDYFADNYAPLQQQKLPHLYGANPHSVNSGCDTPAPCHGGQGAYATHATSPDAHAYGASVQGRNGYRHQGHGAQQSSYAYGPRGRSNKGLRQAYTYGELGVTSYDIDSDLVGALGRLGYQSKSIFGAELEGTLGATNDKKTLGTILTALKVKNSLAGFGVARVPVSHKLNLLGRAGYHRTQLSLKATDALGSTAKQTFSTDGLAYGMGAEYALSPATSLRVDYTIYDYDGPDADAVSLSIARKF